MMNRTPLRPSSCLKYYYLVERDWTASPGDHGDEPGRWIFFVEPQDVDAMWETLSTAFKLDHLPENVMFVRCSTARASMNRSHVLNVHCSGSSNREQTMAVAQIVAELLGYDNRMYYKEGDQKTYRYTYDHC